MRFIMIVLACLICAIPVFAQEEAAAPVPPWAPDTGDVAWMLVSTALVLLMTAPGLALFYSGLVRRKNVIGTMMQSFAMMSLISLQWYVCGYSIAFHEGSGWGGLDWMFLNGVTATEPDPYGYAATIPHQLFMMFQLMFAIITPALITGAFAERMRFGPMAVFLVLWSTIVYDPLAHWVWGKGGWLRNGDGNEIIGALDFAGGTVVHVSSGISALVCALYLGKRRGYPKEMMQPHNLTYSFIGAALLWFGWFGFNAGSAVGATSLAVTAFVTTHFATAAAALSWTIAEWIEKGKPSVLGGISGAVAGLVAITPACGFVTPCSAVAIGLIAGVVCFFSCTWLKNKFGYDDSLDAFGVHGVGGTAGALLTGIFASAAVNPLGANGLLYGNAKLLLNQAIAVGVAGLLAAVATYGILLVVDRIFGLRVSDQDELDGLDLTQHGESGYKF